MLRIWLFTLPTVMLALAGCETVDVDKPRPVVTIEAPTKADIWKQVATADDQDRLTRIGQAWADGLAEARAGGFRNDVKGEGELLESGAALARAAPTPGSYSCRVVTLGRQGGKGPAFQKFKPFFCYVEAEGDLFTIVKQTGSKRPAGRLWDDDDVANRMVFLGTIAVGNEDEARAYGEDPKRNVAGVFERVGAFKWRLAIPYPRSGAKLEVFELTPVVDQPAA